MDINTANRLYELRKAKGYSQDELADLIGVSRQAVSKWERGESSPDTDNLIALAKLYGVSIDELLDYKPQNAQYAQNEQNSQSAQSDYQAKNNDTDFQKSNVYVRINSDGIEIHAPHSSTADTNNTVDGDFYDDIKNETEDENIDGKIDENDEYKDGTVDDKKHRFDIHLGDDGIRITSNGKQRADDCLHIKADSHKRKRDQAIKSAISGIVFLLSLIAYLVMGFVAKLWHPGWIIFFAPILTDGIVEVFLKKNPNHFPMPILCIASFLLLGFLGGYWHPGWVVFLAIPSYYAIVSPLYSTFKKKDSVCSDFSEEQGNVDYQQDRCHK